MTHQYDKLVAKLRKDANIFSPRNIFGKASFAHLLYSFQIQLSGQVISHRFCRCEVASLLYAFFMAGTPLHLLSTTASELSPDPLDFVLVTTGPFFFVSDRASLTSCSLQFKAPDMRVPVVTDECQWNEFKQNVSSRVVEKN